MNGITDAHIFVCRAKPARHTKMCASVIYFIPFIPQGNLARHTKMCASVIPFIPQGNIKNQLSIFKTILWKKVLISKTANKF